MSFELALLIWLGSLFWAAGIFDDLAAKGIAALFRTPPKRSAARSGLNSGSAVRSVPSRSGGNFFARTVTRVIGRARPVRTTKTAVADGQTFYMDTEIDWKWPK